MEKAVCAAAATGPGAKRAGEWDCGEMPSAGVVCPPFGSPSCRVVGVGR